MIFFFRCANALEKYFQTRMKEVGLWDKWSESNVDEFLEVKQSTMCYKNNHNATNINKNNSISHFSIFHNHNIKKSDTLGPSSSVKISQTSGKKPMKSTLYQNMNFENIHSNESFSFKSEIDNQFNVDENK